MMELAPGFRAKNKMMKNVHGGGIVPNSDTLLVIKLPNSLVLRVIARSFLLAMVIITLPCIVPLFRAHSSSYVDDYEPNSESDVINYELLNLMCRDLADEGLVKRGDKALVLSSGIEGLANSLGLLNENEVHVVMEDELDRRQSSISDESFDFAFTSSFQNANFIDRVVKTGGIVAVLLNNYPLNGFRERSNYEIVYLRRFSFTVVAMRKTGPAANELVKFSTNRRLCTLSSEAKKSALKGLEDVLLEPPSLKRALSISNKYLKKFKYLPDLLRDSLKSYRRRIFINVGSPEENESTLEWFNQNYPQRNQDFKVYNLEMTTNEPSSTRVDVLDWMVRNVKEEEYVVMKAEAEMVEEMIQRKTICLVDELFLECKNQWQDGGEESNKSKNRRAYWECLALYGRLIDEGVGVHQWWS